MKRIDLFCDFLEIISFFKQRLGARNYIVFLLHFLASLSESLGIVIAVPLLILGFGKLIHAKFDSNAIELPGDVGELIISITEELSGSTLLVIIVVFFLTKSIFLFLSMYIGAIFRTKISTELKNEILTLIIDARYRDFIQQSTGHTLNLINEQVSRVQTTYSSLLGLVAGIISFCVYMFFLFFSSWTFCLAALIFIVTSYLVFKLPNDSIKNLSRSLVSFSSEFTSSVVGFIFNYKYFKSTDSFELMMPKINAIIDSLRKTQLKIAAAYSASYCLREPLILAFLILVVYFELIAQGKAIETLLVSMLLLYRGATTVFSLHMNWQGILEHKGSIEILNHEIQILKQNAETASGELVASSFDITFESIYFKYFENNRFVLLNLNLVIPSNSMVAFVGKSGSGKTSLLDLICCLHCPTSGHIKIGGVFLSDLDKKILRRRIGYVTQDLSAIDGTIAQNIAVGATAAEILDESCIDKIIEALRMACLYQLITTLPNGIHTEIGERGISLSGGERQRLLLARAFYRKPSILVLDEATSAQDPMCEATILDNIRNSKEIGTTILVSHRLDSLKAVDLIYVLDDGKVIECDTYLNLVNSPTGQFSKLINAKK
jgi:ABC-type bacteriocin/lantibiotic exporter with double-glycine peptidase domain